MIFTTKNPCKHAFQDQSNISIGHRYGLQWYDQLNPYIYIPRIKIKQL